MNNQLDIARSLKGGAPILIAAASERAAYRFLEFSTAQIRTRTRA